MSIQRGVSLLLVLALTIFEESGHTGSWPWFPLMLIVNVFCILILTALLEEIVMTAAIAYKEWLQMLATERDSLP